MEGIPRLPMTCPGINTPIGGIPDGFALQVKEVLLLFYFIYILLVYSVKLSRHA